MFKSKSQFPKFWDSWDSALGIFDLVLNFTNTFEDYEHLVVRMEKIMAKCTLLLEQANDCYPPKRKIGKV